MKIYKILDPRIKDEAWSEQAGSFYTRTSNLISVVFVSLCLLLLSVGVLLTTNPDKKVSDVYIVGPQGTEKVSVVNSPTYSANRIQSWSSEAIKEIYTINFSNFETKFDKNKEYFTKEGWTEFERSKASMREKIVGKKLEMLLTPLTSPRIIEMELRPNGWMYWKIEAPVLMTYYGALKNKKGTASDFSTVVLTIFQISPLENPAGLGIQSLSFE